jgi:hypothetical protein
MSVTRMKRRMVALRAALVEIHDSLDAVEFSMRDQQVRLLDEMDAVLRVLSSMLQVHGNDARLASSIRERMDSTLDERLRLMAMEGGGQ